jgi:hypothetical protein
VHNESGVAAAVQRGKSEKPGRGTCAVGSRYPKTGGTAIQEDSVRGIVELYTVTV